MDDYLNLIRVTLAGIQGDVMHCPHVEPTDHPVLFIEACTPDDNTSRWYYTIVTDGKQWYHVKWESGQQRIHKPVDLPQHILDHLMAQVQTELTEMMGES